MDSLYDKLQLNGPGKQTRFLRILQGGPDDEISTELYVGSLEEEIPDFKAIPYAWESEGITPKTININAVYVRVPDNIHTILQKIRSNFCTASPTDIWIDSICINQKSIPEKNLQVPLMGDIYSKASRVIVWLENTEESADDFHLTNLRLLIKNISMPMGPFINGLSKTMQSKWFQRTWTLQEVSLPSRDPLVMRGNALIDWDYLMRSCHNLKALLMKPILSPSFEVPEELLGLEENLKDLHDIYHQYSTEVAEETRKAYQLGKCPKCGMGDLKQHIFLARGQRATDRRDRVWGLLGLADNEARRSLPVDYERGEIDVFIDVFKYFTGGEAGFQILSRAAGLKCIPNWPTWLVYPDIHQRCETLVRGHYERCRRYKASLGLVARYELIGLNQSLVIYGILVSEVAELMETLKTHYLPRLALSEIDYGSIFNFFAPTCVPDFYNPKILNPAEWEDKVNVYVGGPDSTSPNRYAYLDWHNKHCSEALARVIVGDHISLDQDDTEHLPVSSEFISTILTMGYGLHRTRQKHPRVTDETKSATDGEADKGSDCEPGSDPEVPDYSGLRRDLGFRFKLKRSISRTMTHRLAFKTSGGFIGFGPDDMEPGDKVVLIAGADVPFILRRRGDHFAMVGECYVQGLMHGELFQQYPEFESGKPFQMTLDRFVVY
ncbi:heterokaryon incompatibility protein-domain-containing protein [Hypoxylon trugodes]|uniref:heterokaryon incompatibility protein-domain-containing protein n=1 Tax=Hypoxylon trugodes TaxID=326681 RepID=UPI00218E2698|nr:heterokaryon incompatibility protein-domain-containing protein [Hypoxylon trugodes]KAI1384273.1 heterokaryon incompatibility protein-domain-containing protein [Hypoxylon trugodes]